MQVLAKEGEQTISAILAEKGKLYHCPECGSSLRLRSGPHRQPHFYHTHAQRSCRQHQKSLEHVQMQTRLLHLLGDQAEMERPFPEIERIADVVCHLRKCVFEVQCSPITLEEATQRTNDYRSIGYEVVWILHDRRFNKKKITAAERYLREQGCYFTDCDKLGQGKIYDQFELLAGHYRSLKGTPLAVRIEALTPMPLNIEETAPEAILKRMQMWRVHAKGDLTDRYLKADKTTDAFAHLRQIENKKTPTPRLSFWTLCKCLYVALLDCLLAKLTSSRLREK